jgi:hypothetical protein
VIVVVADHALRRTLRSLSDAQRDALKAGVAANMSTVRALLRRGLIATFRWRPAVRGYEIDLTEAGIVGRRWLARRAELAKMIE